jgi:hypothetical protein
LPENCTIRVTFVTRENEPAKNVTVSYKACFETSNATTIVTTSKRIDTTTGRAVYTGTASGVTGATGSQTRLFIKSTTAEVTRSLSECLYKLIDRQIIIESYRCRYHEFVDTRITSIIRDHNDGYVIFSK